MYLTVSVLIHAKVGMQCAHAHDIQVLTSSSAQRSVSLFYFYEQVNVTYYVKIRARVKYQIPFVNNLTEIRWDGAGKDAVPPIGDVREHLMPSFAQPFLEENSARPDRDRDNSVENALSSCSCGKRRLLQRRREPPA